MPSLGLGVNVDSPPVAPPLHNLVVSAQTVTEPDDRWTQGLHYEGEGCEQPGIWSPACPPSDLNLTGDTELADCVAEVDYQPFMVETTIGQTGPPALFDRLVARAKRTLEAVTPKGVELEFWTGAKDAANPHLASGAAVTVIEGVTPQPPLVALARLQAAIGSCGAGGRGMIHAPIEAAAQWAEYVMDEGPKLVTRVRKDIVVAGAGYPGTSPAGAAPAAGSTWVYATPGVAQIRLSEMELPARTAGEAFNRRTNKYEVRAERYAAVTWSGCCLFGILVDVNGP